MIDYEVLHKSSEKHRIDNQMYEDTLPKLFRIDYEISFRDDTGLNRVSRERKTCFICGYTIEDCREKLFKSCGNNPCRIETEGKVCRVDGLTDEVINTIYRVNGVEKPKSPKKSQMRKLSNVDENTNSINIGKFSDKVNTLKDVKPIDKDRGEIV